MPSEDEQIARLDFLTDIVYPFINTKCRPPAKHINRLKSNSELKETVFHDGTHVMVKDALKSTNAQPTYLESYTVVRRNQAGVDVLKESAGNIPKRYPKILKLVLRSNDTTHVTKHNVTRVVKHGDVVMTHLHANTWRSGSATMSNRGSRKRSLRIRDPSQLTSAM